MAKNITLMGASYPDVPAVELPQTGGGTATFYDVQGSKNIDTNGTYDVTTFSEVSVNVSGGGGSSSVICVEFVDGYQGNVLYSYTKADFLNLSSMPSNPTISGLISQGWNWSLASAKAYIQKHDYLIIGQNYVTESGDTEIDIVLEDGRTSPYLCIAVNGTVSVDWGDNSSISTITGRSSTSPIATLHEYSSPGSYTITISVVSGSFAIYRSSRNSGTYRFGLLSKYDASGSTYSNVVYLNTIVAVRLGNDVTVGDYAFYYCYSLQHIAIPNTVTSIGIHTFDCCYSIKTIAIPDTVTSMSDYAFYYCYSLQQVSIPGTLTSIGNSAFYHCNSLQHISIPDTVTSMGTYAFYYCQSLQHISLPDTLTSIGIYAFSSCNSLQHISLPDTLTSIGNYAFSSCCSLQHVSIPDTVTSIGTNIFNSCYSLRSASISANISSIGSSIFRNCYSLQQVSIPDTLTSISDYTFGSCYSLMSISIPYGVTAINTRAFESCYCLRTVSIPDTVTSIGNYAFSSCTGLSMITFSSITPPTLGGSTVFSNLPSDCKIYVPRGTLADYTSATNYPSSSTYTYVEYDV